jgi:protein-S-isoprenylcysteine O-methyltransferase Ste14
MTRLATHVAWVIGIYYSTIPAFWMVVHPFVDHWRSRKGRVAPLLLTIWLAIMAIFALATFPWHEKQLYSTPLSWLVGFVFFVLAILGYRRSKGFGRARLFGLAELAPERHEQRLITSGMHARVRHPIYLAHLCMLTAWTLGSGTVAMFALWLTGVVTGAIMIHMEDAELEERFGNEYREYRQRVPAVIPRF